MPMTYLHRIGETPRCRNGVGEFNERARKTPNALLLVCSLVALFFQTGHAFAEAANVSLAALHDTFKAGSTATDQERQERLKSIQGKTIRWQGEVREVRETPDGFKVLTAANASRREVSCIVSFPRFRAKAVSGLKPGETIRYEGMIQGTFQGSLLIENAYAASSWGTGAGKSYLVPALEIPGFILLLNGYSRLADPDLEEKGKKVYDVTWTTFRDHVVEGPWGFDQDNFDTNQFRHPYQGAMYHGFARSAGLGYWESSAYTFAGSLLWETGGETTSPSFNDQIASGIAGSFFGEPLFRMASLILEGEGVRPGFWRELGVAGLSPPLGFNRLVFGDRFKSVFPSHDPANFWRLRFGESIGRVSAQGVNAPINSEDATVDFAMSYGLPGKPGYAYDRPFDYFHFEVIATSDLGNLVEDVMIRGLLFGKKYEVGDSYRGIWGLYGGYDYIAPQVFRVSSTALSLGTTCQWWLARGVALQGSALGGFGYGAAGTISGLGERNYHYGVDPQALLALRLLFGDRVMLDTTGRAYYISDVGGTEPGREEIGRLNAGLTVRVVGRHGLGIQFIASSRDANYPNRADVSQTTETVSLVYTLLCDAGFSSVQWGDAGSR